MRNKKLAAPVPDKDQSNLLYFIWNNKERHTFVPNNAAASLNLHVQISLVFEPVCPSRLERYLGSSEEILLNQLWLAKFENGIFQVVDV